jgi:hypothetical protein
MKHSIATALLAVLLAAPALAGMTYESTTTIKGPQGDQVIRTEGWVEGDNAKVVFEQSDNPLFTEGGYLLTTDGGRTLLMVNPKEKTYMPFDIGQLAGMAGAMMQGLGGMVKMSFTNHRIEKLVEEPGGQLLGHDTTHYRFRTSYDMEIRVMGMGQASANETVTDTWATTSLADPGFGAWLRRDPPKTGIADLDALIAAEVSQGVSGVPLKMVSVTTSKDKKKGKTQTTTTTMEVTSLREQAIPGGTFQIPAGYERVEMLTTVPFGQR